MNLRKRLAWKSVGKAVTAGPVLGGAVWFALAATSPAMAVVVGIGVGALTTTAVYYISMAVYGWTRRCGVCQAPYSIDKTVKEELVAAVPKSKTYIGGIYNVSTGTVDQSRTVRTWTEEKYNRTSASVCLACGHRKEKSRTTTRSPWW